MKVFFLLSLCCAVVFTEGMAADTNGISRTEEAKKRMLEKRAQMSEAFKNPQQRKEIAKSRASPGTESGGYRTIVLTGKDFPKLGPGEEMVGEPGMIQGPNGVPQFYIVTHTVTDDELAMRKRDQRFNLMFARELANKQAKMERDVRAGRVSEDDARQNWKEANHFLGSDVRDDEGWSVSERESLRIK